MVTSSFRMNCMFHFSLNIVTFSLCLRKMQLLACIVFDFNYYHKKLICGQPDTICLNKGGGEGFFYVTFIQ